MLEILDLLWDKELKYRIWPEAAAEVRRHLAEGREVWLLTASPQELGDLIATRLGATGALGTLVEVQDGLLTGKLVGKPLHGVLKRKAAKELAKQRGISLKKSWAYSDSQNDLPLLTAVGHPIAVNPDKLLKRHATAANWPIMEFKKRDLKQNQDD
jgi:HAD superfamily hydrolase (TIGR01490 family)